MRLERSSCVRIRETYVFTLAGLLLRRHGWEVDVFELVESELAGRGAGIVAQPELIETLRRLGIDPADLGVHATTRRILAASGRLTAELSYRDATA